jgi:hypothetical protein
MQVHQLNSFYLVDQVEQHGKIKDQLLSLLDTWPVEHPRPPGDDDVDRVDKLDWGDSQNVNRPWVRLFAPILQRKLIQMMHQVGYKDVKIENLWFQQYVKNDIHNWHIHGSTWVGVYYLEMDPRSPITELMDPIDQKTVIVPELREGDIILFPSHVIHRAPRIDSDIRKTIISFNYTCGNIETGLMSEISKLK